MNVKKTLIGIAFMALILLPLSTQIASGENDQITVKVTAGDVVTVTTEKMSIKIIPNQGHLMWWYGNRASTDETFKLQLVKIREFLGNDSILDSQSEFNDVSFNLINNDWQYQIDEADEELTITLSLIDFLNSADMYIVMHIYNYDTPIADTTETVDALSELKFDIIVNDWVFSEGAQGIAIQSYLTEVEHKHQVSIRNGTLAENGVLKRTMFFESFQYDFDVVAYYEWLNYANVYNNDDDLIDTIEVGTAYFDDLATPPTDMPGFAEGLAHLYLTYPNFGDDNKMVHDPTIGVVEETHLDAVPLYIIPLIAGLFAISTVALIIRKRK